MKTLKKLSLFVLFIFAFSSCNNDDDKEPEPNFVQIDEYTKKYKNGVVEVSYYKVPTKEPIAGKTYQFYNFDKMAFMDVKDPKTENWDIVFTDATVSKDIYGVINCHYSKASSNNIIWATGTDAFNVTGGFILKPFDELETVPEDFTYSMSTKSAGLTGAALFDDPGYLNGSSCGYFVNDRETEKPLYMMMYTNKCHIVKLNDGRLVKFQYINSYNNKPEDNNKDSQRGYLSFRYYIAQAGSRDVKTNQTDNVIK